MRLREREGSLRLRGTHLAGDDEGIVEGQDHREALLVGEPASLCRCLVVVVAVESDLRQSIYRHGPVCVVVVVVSRGWRQHILHTSVVAPPKVRTASTLIRGVARGMTITARHPR